MKHSPPDLMRGIERLKDNNDFSLFINWIAESADESIELLLCADSKTVQTQQGYSKALADILAAVNRSRETLDRSNKRHRDTL